MTVAASSMVVVLPFRQVRRSHLEEFYAAGNLTAVGQFWTHPHILCGDPAPGLDLAARKVLVLSSEDRLGRFGGRGLSVDHHGAVA